MWSHNSNDTCLHSDDEVKKSSLLHCGCGELLRNRLRIYIRSSAGVKLACTAGFSFTLKPVRCERIYKSYKVRIKRKKRTFIMITMLMELLRNSCLIGFSALLAPVNISATPLTGFSLSTIFFHLNDQQSFFHLSQQSFLDPNDQQSFSYQLAPAVIPSSSRFLLHPEITSWLTANSPNGYASS